MLEEHYPATMLGISQSDIHRNCRAQSLKMTLHKPWKLRASSEKWQHGTVRIKPCRILGAGCRPTWLAVYSCSVLTPNRTAKVHICLKRCCCASTLVRPTHASKPQRLIQYMLPRWGHRSRNLSGPCGVLKKTAA
jgi:hypothetical protein